MRVTPSEFRGEKHTVKLLQHNETSGVLISAFVSAGAGVSREFAETITKHRAITIDNSSAFLMDADVPLVVPEVNGEDAFNTPSRHIANPNCTTAIVVVALKPLK